MFGIAALCANLYLAVTAANGRSLGKAFQGLRLVVGESEAKPGLRRGLVRSSLEAVPYMGWLMLLTGAHDAFAGTRIVLAKPTGTEVTVGADGPIDDSPVAAWKVGVAICLHLFLTFVYMILGAFAFYL